jgi:hypothetical protein
MKFLNKLNQIVRNQLGNNKRNKRDQKNENFINMIILNHYHKLFEQFSLCGLK